MDGGGGGGGGSGREWWEVGEGGEVKKTSNINKDFICSHLVHITCAVDLEDDSCSLLTIRVTPLTCGCI